MVALPVVSHCLFMLYRYLIGKFSAGFTITYCCMKVSGCSNYRRKFLLTHLCREYHNSLIKLDKIALYSQGAGVFGALGLGNLKDQPNFCKVPIFNAVPIIVATGWGHSVFTSDLGLILFGRPFDFQSLMRINRLYSSFIPILGRIASGTSSWFGPKDITGLYKDPMLISDMKVCEVSCSAGLSIFTTISGEVYSFGLNRWGQCGFDENIPHLYSPKRVPINEKVIAVDTGLQHVICLTDEGKVYTWGKGERGQLGNGNDENSSTAVAPDLPSKVVSIGAGLNSCAAVTSDGAAYIWGKGLSKTPVAGTVTGINVGKHFKDQLHPRRVELPSGRKAVKVHCSNFVMVFLAHDGSLWALGRGEYDRNMISDPIPVMVHDSDWNLDSSTLVTTTTKTPNAPSDIRTGLSAASVEAVNESVYLSTGMTLKKGYHRVCIFDTSSDLRHASSSILTSVSAVTGARPLLPPFGVFEVVLHEGIASVQPVELPGLEHGVSLVDLSCGWKHKLAIIKEAEIETENSSR